MFKRLRIRIAAAMRNKTRRPALFASTSEEATPPPAESQEHLLSQEPKSPPEPHLAATKGAETTNLPNTEDVSFFELDGCSGPSLYASKCAFHKAKMPEESECLNSTKVSQVTHRDTYWLDREDDVSPGTIPGPMKLVKVRRDPKEFMHARGLLLTAAAYKRVQSLHRHRRDLRATISYLAESGAEIESLSTAKRDLEEEQVCREVPGAFIDGDPHAERERRGLLVSRLEERLWSCRRNVQRLEAEKQRLQAELGVVQEQLLRDLEHAWQKDREARGAVSREDSEAWWVSHGFGSRPSTGR